MPTDPFKAFENICMYQSQLLIAQLEAMDEAPCYPFHIVAFVKHGQKMTAFLLDPNRDLQSFVEKTIAPIHDSSSREITPLTLRFVAFHQADDHASLTMEKNPVYLSSYSLKSGFFLKTPAKKAKAA